MQTLEQRRSVHAVDAISEDWSSSKASSAMLQAGRRPQYISSILKQLLGRCQGHASPKQQLGVRSKMIFQSSKARRRPDAGLNQSSILKQLLGRCQGHASPKQQLGVRSKMIFQSTQGPLRRADLKYVAYPNLETRNPRPKGPKPDKSSP